jgi:hypothetical protein
MEESMKRLVFSSLTVLSMAVLALALSAVPANASPIITSCTDTSGFDTAVTASTVVTCGSLTFENFAVLHATSGAAGIVDLTGASYSGGTTVLNFDPNLGPNQDEYLMFEVLGGISQIDMSVGGNNAVVTERACANPIPTSGTVAYLCTNLAGTSSVAPLGTISVQSGTSNQPVLSSPFSTTSPVYIFKDILTGSGGELSVLNQSFETVPEPSSMFLLGSGLIGLVGLRRKLAA